MFLHYQNIKIKQHKAEKGTSIHPVVKADLVLVQMRKRIE